MQGRHFSHCKLTTSAESHRIDWELERPTVEWIPPVRQQVTSLGSHEKHETKNAVAVQICHYVFRGRRHLLQLIPYPRRPQNPLVFQGSRPTSKTSLLYYHRLS